MAIFLLAIFLPKINEANFLNPAEDNSVYVFAYQIKIIITATIAMTE